MCENDTVGEKVDVKPDIKMPLSSGGSTGVSKIFILTPEILQTLGLAGFTTTRIASCDSSKTIKFNLPTLQGIQASADQKEGNKNVITLGKLLEGNVVNATVVKTPRRDSARVENSNDLGETSKSLISSSNEAEQRLNEEEKEKTVTSNKAKGSDGHTLPKAKNVRRKSNVAKLANSETQDSNVKKTSETKNESETIASASSTTPKTKNVRRKHNAAKLASSEQQETDDQKTTEIKTESKTIASISSTTPKAKNIRRKSNAPNLPSTETPESNDKKNTKSETVASIGSTTPKAKNVRCKNNATNFPSTETRESNNEKNTESEEISSVGSTLPKAKNARRKSNAGNLSTSERRESSDKKTLEMANKSEAGAVGVRTSKRVAKPKKFDDFILTENLLTYGKANKDEKSRSRRSSVNSDLTQPVTKNKKNESGKVKEKEKSDAMDLVVETIDKKTVEKKVPKPENSNDVAFQSSSENCFAVPEPPTTARRKSVDKSNDKRIPKKTTVTQILGSQEKTPSKKGVEVADFKQPHSETGNNVSLREEVFLVPKSPTSVGKNKLHKAHESGSIIQYLVKKSPTDSESRVAETTLNKEIKPGTEKEKSKAQTSLSMDTADSGTIQEVEKTLKKGNEILAFEQQNLKTQERVSTDSSNRLQEVATTLKKTDQISVSEQNKSESMKNECTVQNSVNSRDERENFPPVTAEVPRSLEPSTEVSLKMSLNNSSDKKNKARISKSIVQESLDNKKETTGSSSNLSGSLNTDENIIASKSDLPRSADKNQQKTTNSSEISEPHSQTEKNDLSSRESDAPRLSIEKEEVCTSRTDSSETVAKNEVVRASKQHSPRSRHVKQTVNSLKLYLLKPLEKKREGSGPKADLLKSPERKQEAINSKSDKVKSPEKKQQEPNSSKSNALKSPEKEQKETKSSNSESLKPPEKKQQEANSSKSDSLKSLENNEKINSPKSNSLQSTYKKGEIGISLFDPPSPLDTAVQIEKVLDMLSSQDEEEDASRPQFSLEKSSIKKEFLSNSGSVSPEPPNKKQRSIISQFALPRSADEKEISVSEFASPKSPNKIEEISHSNITLPRSPDKEEKDTEALISKSILSNCSATSIEFSDKKPTQSISPNTKEVGNAFRLDASLSSDKIESTETVEPTSPFETQVYSELFDTAMEVDSMSDSDGNDNTEMSVMNETSCNIEVDDFTKGDDTSISPKHPGNNVEGLFTSPVETKVDTELFNIEMENCPMHPDKNANTEIPVIKDTSLHIGNTEIATDIPLNNTFTDEAIKVDDAISTPKARHQNTESQKPVRTYSRRRRSQQTSKMPETPHVLETDISMETANTTVDKNSLENTPRRKRRVPKNEDVTDGKGLSDGSEDEADNNQVRTRRRGRPSSVISYGPSKGRLRGRGRRRIELDTEYVPRVSSSGKEKTKVGENVDIDNSQQATAITKTVESSEVSHVECGKCNERMEKKNWIKHNLSKHNNMGWLAGSPAPDWDTDIKLLRSILTSVLKRKKKTQLTCETCGTGKRSANGFISHLQFCGKTDDERLSLMVTCPVCDHTMMPSSMEMHERTHRQDDKTEKEKRKVEAAGVTPSSGRGKRKAAEKAATKITEFTNLVKDDEPATKKQRTKEEMVELIEKPQSTGKAPSRFKGIWKSDIAKNGKALCRHHGCTFETDSFEVICNHHSECSFAPRSNWVCKLCLFSSLTEEEALKHVETEHSTNKSRENPESDFENSNSSSSIDSDSELSDDKPTTFKKDDRYQIQDYNVKFLDEEVKVDSRWPFTFPPALRWTMEFESKNYCLRLFEDLSPNNMRLLEDNESLEYLPELSVSMKVKISEARSSTPACWEQWERFEGTVVAGIPTCFVGGPVWAIAWLPIPAPMYNQSAEQFVAVSTHSTMESDYEVGKSYVGNNIIQIWNLGPLDHSKSVSLNAPVLSYGVAHDKGTIWCMEWCPSGCYEDPILFDSETNTTTKRRMGLLATACSDGCVHVFSLPFPDELEFSKNTNDSRLPIYETKPILTLTIDTRMYDQGEQNWQCTKLNWCKELGHDMIIAGFSNGHVAIWDLGSKTPLFVTTRGETTFIDAFHHFYAHGHAISAIQMIPYGGKRFFITSSYDRMTKLWDLEDTNYPVTVLKRGIAVDGSWFTHWPAYATAYDDVLTYAHTYLLSLRQQGSKIFPLLPTNSTTYSVTTSDYGNSVGHGTLAGEVVVMFPNYMWTYKDMERLSYKKRWLASTVEVVDFESEKSGMKRKKSPKTYEYMPETYDGCKDRYGLVFRDKLHRAQQHNRHSKSRNPFAARLKSVNVEQYPFASANRVSWNPNAWSYLWMCVAYQNGIVRFLNFKTVALDKELRKLLPSHAKSMLKKAKILETKSKTNFVISDPTVSQTDS